MEVVGKIRPREGKVSITCDEAKPYNIQESSSHQLPENQLGTTPELPTPAQHQTGTSVESENQKNGTAGPTLQKLWIVLEESTNSGHDQRVLREIVKVLLNYPGEGAVALRIKTDNKTVIGELPFVSVNYCHELHLELAAMVGETGIEVVDSVK